MDPRSLLNRVVTFSKSSARFIEDTWSGYRNPIPSYSVQLQGFEYRRVEIGVAADFSVDTPFLSLHRETLLKVYEGYTSIFVEEKTVKSFQERLSLVEKTVKQYNASFKVEEGKSPLENVKQVQEAVRGIVYKEIEKTGKLSIRKNSFKEDVDEAHREVMKMFYSMFEDILKTKELNFNLLKTAFSIAERMSHSRAGVKAFCTLAEAFLKMHPQNYKNPSICLNAIGEGEYESNFIQEEDIFSFCRALKEDQVVAIAYKISQNQVKKLLVHFLFIKYSGEKKREALNSLTAIFKEDTEKQTELCEKIIEYYLDLTEIPLKKRAIYAFEATKLTTSKPCGKIIDRLFSENEVPFALELLAPIEEDSIRNREYEKIIGMYLERDQAAKALPLIPLLRNGLQEEEQYKKIVQHHLQNKAFIEATLSIARIESEETRQREYQKVAQALLNYFTEVRKTKQEIDCRSILQAILSHIKDKHAIMHTKTLLGSYL